MNKVTLHVLRHLLDKVIYDHLNPYYSQDGYSVYKDGMILLRSNFFEPLLNENLTDSWYKSYIEFFNKNIQKHPNQRPKSKENLPFFEKLVLVNYQGNRPLNPDETLPIFIANKLYLNDAVHNNPGTNQRNFVRCYFALQNFFLQLDNSEASEVFQSETDIIDYINKNVNALGARTGDTGKNDNILILEKLAELWALENEYSKLNAAHIKLQSKVSHSDRKIKQLSMELSKKNKECEALQIELSIEKANFELAKCYHRNKKGEFNSEIHLLENQITELEHKLKSEYGK